MFLDESKKTQRRKLIERANENVSITALYRKLGLYIPRDIPMGDSFKTYCTFGYLHSDGGMSQALRIYPGGNHAYCFAESLQITPVKLWALTNDLRYHEAAEELLVGIKIEEEQEAEPTLDTSALAHALTIYCERTVTEWEQRQFEDHALRTAYTRCLELLPRVQTDEDAIRWLHACKEYIARHERNANGR